MQSTRSSVDFRVWGHEKPALPLCTFGLWELSALSEASIFLTWEPSWLPCQAVGGERGRPSTSPEQLV